MKAKGKKTIILNRPKRGHWDEGQRIDYVPPKANIKRL
jgi:hypothetical protein